MKYRVTVTAEAEREIRETFRHIYGQAPLNAARWIRGLYEEVGTLEQFPERCGHTRELEAVS